MPGIAIFTAAVVLLGGWIATSIGEASGSRARLRMGVRGFLMGDRLLYHGVMFMLRHGSLQVYCYSDFSHAENITESEAREKIARSKEVLKHLARENRRFRSMAARLPHSHNFCQGDASKTVIRAYEADGRFIWRG